MVDLPAGFRAHTANLGVKDDTPDFAVVVADRPVPADAVFTKSRFAGASVTLSRHHVADGMLQGFVVISKNANVATGTNGDADAWELTESVGAALGIPGEQLLVASTGVIGVPYPMDRIRPRLAELPVPDTTDAEAVARAIMTTDTHPKTAEATVGAARIVGVAKGVGMLEPDMATMLAFVLTDAELSSTDLRTAFRGVVDQTFNSLSVDTDTSTSDTAAILASGAAGPVDLDQFTVALAAVCLDLTRQLASDGEGAETLIVVTVRGARDHAQAKRVAKAIVNSPLVKTAVHGADPNWGRIAMAIGKCSDDTDIDQRRVTICFGDEELYPKTPSPHRLESLAEYLAGNEVAINVDLGIADGVSTVYGCDLTDGYVRINADYTT